eukprot:TRINITY_DN15468_c0_g1_i1.p1 TRINITY_DN15468_c0_g1~~TRINITY_DN15468_c0_g1_i1.p1  ORF type:complete len:160 (-),score=46.82 TRINITY_DN15468_c0_g1_i1:480-899(-)
MRAKRSLIWYCYDMLYKGEEKFGSCKSCKIVLKCSSGSTTSLLYHIKNKHQHLYQEFEQKKDLELSFYRKDYDDKCKEEPKDEKDAKFSATKECSESKQIELTGDDFLMMLSMCLKNLQVTLILQMLLLFPIVEKNTGS